MYMYALKVYRLYVLSWRERDAFVLVFRSFGLKKRGKKKKKTCESDAYASHESRIGVPNEGLLFEERRETNAAARKDTRETKGVRREEPREEGRRSRTLGGSSQSSGWVSTRPVIIGAYLHEHTSNVPNQTSSHVARVGRHCSRVYKARLFLFLAKKNHVFSYSIERKRFAMVQSRRMDLPHLRNLHAIYSV